MTLTLLNLKTVPLPTSAPSFLPSIADARALITPRTRAIVLITPCNPTGTIAPPELIQEFADLAVEHKIALILDGTYRDFVPPVPNPDGGEGEMMRGKPHDLFATPKWREGVVELFSFSKVRLPCL